MSTVWKGVAVAVVVCVGHLGASATATAQPVQVVAEPSGEPCDACEVHLVGESYLRHIATGLVVSRCSDELLGNLYEDGGGEFEWLGGGPECAFTACSASVENHWPATALDELGDGTSKLDVRVCLRYVPTGTDIHCTMELAVASPALHRYQYADVRFCATTWELGIDWQTEELASEIELIHSDR